MTNAKKSVAPTWALGEKLVYATFEILRDNGNEMPMRELMAQVEKKVKLDDWAKATYEKSGYIRWQSLLHFFSIDCLKAGYLVKKKGTWYLTPEGEEAISLGPTGLLKEARKAYQKWKSEQPIEPVGSEKEPDTDDVSSSMAFEDIEQTAMRGLERFIGKKNAYEFQDMVAALLRGMGYHTPFVAPKGKDGGIDVVAYQDPLGTESPRIKVQIKHRETSASVQEIRQLIGLLQKEGDVGIFVSAGGFSPDAKSTARLSHVHIELIDLSRFINLWQEFYEEMTDEDKSLLPLTPIYFLAKEE